MVSYWLWEASTKRLDRNGICVEEKVADCFKVRLLRTHYWKELYAFDHPSTLGLSSFKDTVRALTLFFSPKGK